MASLGSGPTRVQESQANVQLGQQGQQLLAVSREQFDGIRERYRQNLMNEGNDVARDRARGIASVNQAPATRGLRSLQGYAGGSAMGNAANQVTNNVSAQRLQAGLNLGQHAVRENGATMSSLGSLAGIQSQRNSRNAARRAENSRGLGALAGLAGYSLYNSQQQPFMENPPGSVDSTSYY